MKPRHSDQVEALNKLIVEVNHKLAAYNQLIRPVMDTEMEITRHQYFFQTCKSSEKQKEEAAIIQQLQKQLAELKASIKGSEKFDDEIDALYARIEKLETQIYGKSDRSSPSFLETKK